MMSFIHSGSRQDFRPSCLSSSRKLYASSAKALAVVLMLFSSTALAQSTAQLGFNQQENQVVISAGDQPIATYVFRDDTIPRPYFAHIHSIDGIRLTRNHPPIEGTDADDHATMHPGIWLAFGDLNGTDIWRNKGRVVHERFIAEPTATKNVLRFTVRNRYETADGKTICHEQCERRFVIQDKQVWLLWDSTFTSQTDFYFGDQEEMGLGVRLATEITVKSKQGGRILDSEGRRNQSEIWSKPAAWCDYGGPVGDRFVGITIVPHAENFRTCRWHARDYGFVAANPFGARVFGEAEESKVTVKAGDNLRLRFGLLMHTGQADKFSDPTKAYRDLVNKLSGNMDEVK